MKFTRFSLVILGPSKDILYIKLGRVAGHVVYDWIYIDVFSLVCYGNKLRV